MLQECIFPVIAEVSSLIRCYRARSLNIVYIQIHFTQYFKIYLSSFASVDLCLDYNLLCCTFVGNSLFL